MKRVNFPMGIDAQTDAEIREMLQDEVKQPEVVVQARQEAYEMVREIARAREVRRIAEAEREKNMGKIAEKNMEKKQENSGSGNLEKMENHMEKKQENSGSGNLEKMEKNMGKKQENSERGNLKKQGKQVGRRRWNGWKTFGSIAAAAAVFSGVCITNPAFAAKVPLVGHVFEQLGDSLGFAGDFDRYAVPLGENSDAAVVSSEEGSEAMAGSAEDTNTASLDVGEDDAEVTGATIAPEDSEENVQDLAYSQTVNGMTVTLSEVYCNEKALYISMLLTTEDTFPETFMAQWDSPIIDLSRRTLKFSYNPDEQWGDGYLDGQMIDDHTFAGVLRVNLVETLRRTDLPEEFSEEEGKTDGGQIDYVSIELPEQFSVDLHIPQISGMLPSDQVTTPEMPQDLIDEYEQAMADAGLDPSDEAYASFTEEQEDIELALRNKQWNEYTQRYPDVNQYPNKYENWWFDGDWDFHFDVTVDHSQTETKVINTGDACEIGDIQVTKTPFELVLDYDYSKALDYFVTVLDADGIPMEYGHGGGGTDTHPIAGYDVSKVTIYVCDYIEYMDELKGYYYQEDYEEKAKEKTYRQVLDEHCIYSQEVTF